DGGRLLRALRLCLAARLVDPGQRGHAAADRADLRRRVPGAAAPASALRPCVAARRRAGLHGQAAGRDEPGAASVSTTPVIAASGSDIVAWHRDERIDAVRFLAHAQAVAAALPDGRHLLNLCADRY